jgi:hypothetical protein
LATPTLRNVPIFHHNISRIREENALDDVPIYLTYHQQLLFPFYKLCSDCHLPEAASLLLHEDHPNCAYQLHTLSLLTILHLSFPEEIQPEY